MGNFISEKNSANLMDKQKNILPAELLPLHHVNAEYLQQRMYSISLDYQSTRWLGFDNLGKSLYGIDLIQTTSSSITFEIRKLNLFENNVETIKQITVNDLFVENRNSIRFAFAISPSGEWIGLARWSSAVCTNVPTNYMLCLISAVTGSIKVYKCNNGIDHLFGSDQSGSPLMCSDKNEWLIKFNAHGHDDSHRYYHIILDHDEMSGRFDFLTETFCKEAYGDFNQMLGDEVFFDRKLIVFGKQDGLLHLMHVYDFTTGNWNKILTDNELDILPCKWRYKIFGRNFDNLYALSTESNNILKYDRDANMWRKTSITVNLNVPFKETRDLFHDVTVFSSLNLLVIKPIIVKFDSHGHDDDDDKQLINAEDEGLPLDKTEDMARNFGKLCFIKNICNVLCLKDLCKLKIDRKSVQFFQSNYNDDVYGNLPHVWRLPRREYYDENIYPDLPQLSSIEELFGVDSPIAQNVDLKLEKNCCC